MVRFHHGFIDRVILKDRVLFQFQNQTFSFEHHHHGITTIVASVASVQNIENPI